MVRLCRTLERSEVTDPEEEHVSGIDEICVTDYKLSIMVTSISSHVLTSPPVSDVNCRPVTKPVRKTLLDCRPIAFTVDAHSLPDSVLLILRPLLPLHPT